MSGNHVEHVLQLLRILLLLQLQVGNPRDLFAGNNVVIRKIAGGKDPPLNIR